MKHLCNTQVSYFLIFFKVSQVFERVLTLLIFNCSKIPCFKKNVDPDPLANRKPDDEDTHGFKYCS